MESAKNDLESMTDVPDEFVVDQPVIDDDHPIENINIEAKVQEYRDMRDELDQRRHEWEAFEKEQKEKMSIISMQFREIADKLGLDALPTKAGTAYRQLKEHYRVSNWDKTLAVIQREGLWHALYKQVSKTAMREYHQQTGEIMDGIEYSADVEFVVRKNSKSR
jgi:hypothetical protein